jgi:hypothetical protein
VEGKIKLSRTGQLPHAVSKGEIIEIKITNQSAAWREVRALIGELRREHLAPAPVGGLVNNSPTSI